jgi:hypothetical protein
MTIHTWLTRGILDRGEPLLLDNALIALDEVFRLIPNRRGEDFNDIVIRSAS